MSGKVGRDRGTAPEPRGEPTAGDRRRRIWLWLALGLVALPLLWCVLAFAVEQARIPADADLVQAAELVRRGYRAGDQVAVAPEWALRGLSQLGDLNPTFDPHLAERPPAAERLWVVAEPEGRATLRALEARYAVDERAQLGRVEVVRFRIGAGRPYRAVDHLAEAEVTIVARSGPVPCDRWRESRWDCEGRPDWQHVGAEWLDVDFAPRQVIWAHPPPTGERLLLRFPDVAFGARIEVLAGHTVHGAQFAKAPVQVVVRASDVEVGRLERQPGYPLQAFTIGSGEVAGRRGTLELEISTPDNGANHFALDVAVYP